MHIKSYKINGSQKGCQKFTLSNGACAIAPSQEKSLGGLDVRLQNCASPGSEIWGSQWAVQFEPFGNLRLLSFTAVDTSGYFRILTLSQITGLSCLTYMMHVQVATCAKDQILKAVGRCHALSSCTNKGERPLTARRTSSSLGLWATDFFRFWLKRIAAPSLKS